MKVYCVIGGTDGEGEDYQSLRLFDCKSTAQMYQKDLQLGTNESGYNEDRFIAYDYAIMESQSVIMKSKVDA